MVEDINYIKKFYEKVSQIGRVKIFEEGAPIIFEGDFGNTIYFLIEGEVNVVTYNESGKEIILATLKALNFFGEISLFDERNRTATIVSHTKCKVVELSKQDFFDFIKKENEIFFILMVEMANRLRKANRKIYVLSLNRAQDRVRCYLKDKYVEYLTMKKPFILPSHFEIAKELGLTRETVTKILGEFKDKGIISATKGEITIKEELLFKY